MAIAPTLPTPWHRPGITLIAVLLFGVGLLTAPGSAGAEGMSPASGTALFEQHCAGCHPQGGNIIRRGKSLKARALRRYHLLDESALAEVITQGRGIMSGYGTRLSTADIQTLARYVQQQAEQGWPQ